MSNDLKPIWEACRGNVPHSTIGWCKFCGKSKPSARHKCLSCDAALAPYRKLQKRALAVTRALVEAKVIPPVRALDCVDCGEPARHYDHRDYSALAAVEPVCVRCNAARGPAKQYLEFLFQSLQPGQCSPVTPDKRVEASSPR
jgi:hypothetical protein